MSTRLHRINKIEYAEHNTVATGDFLDRVMSMQGVYDKMQEGSGILTIQVETLEYIVAKARSLKLDKQAIANFKKDIKWAKEKGDTEIDYDVW